MKNITENKKTNSLLTVLLFPAILKPTTKELLQRSSFVFYLRGVDSMKESIRIRRKTLLRMSAILVSMAMAGTVYSFSLPRLEVGAAAASTQSKVAQLEEMFTTLDLMDITIPELQQALEEGRVTSEELVQMYLDRIEAYDDSLDLNAIISINPDALETARELDAERAAGNVRGPLHGVPIIIKDNYDLEGMATTAGATALKDSIAPDDATVVARLREAGAIVIAKANLSEFAFSGSNSRSAAGGTVHNAYDTSRTPAGSSGGTAVSVTSNFAVAGLGTDTGSSIRRPSSFSNLYGLRPSKGLTSIDGVVPLNADQDVTGPMCRTVEDLAILLDAIAGTDEADHYTVDADADSLVPEEGYASYLNADGLEGKRIGYLTNSFGYYASTSRDDNGEWVTTQLEDPTELDSKVDGMVEQTLDTLQEGGAELVDLSDELPDSLIFELNGAVNNVRLTGSDVFDWDMYEYFQSLGSNATMHSVADIIADGGYISDLSYYGTPVDELVNPRYDDRGMMTKEYEEQWNARLNFRNTVSQILEENDIDAVVYVSQTDIPCLEEDSDGSGTNNNGAAYINKFGPVAGLPDMMIPMGLSETDPANGVDNAMPLGMSLFSSYGNEATLIEIAYGYEQTAGDDIRQQPELLPALPDQELNTFLEDLVTESEALPADDYTQTSYGAVTQALTTAEAVDESDVSAVYQAAYDLADAYDQLETVPEENPGTTTPGGDETTTPGGDTTTPGGDTATLPTGTTTPTGTQTQTPASSTVPVTGDDVGNNILWAGTAAGGSALLLAAAAIWRLQKRRKDESLS